MTTAPAPETGEPSAPAPRRSGTRTLTGLHALVGALALLAVALGAWPALIALAILAADVVLGIRADRAVARRAARYITPDTPEVTVVRDGDHRLVAPADLAPGDVVELEPGAAVVADGDVVAADGLEIDESQVTGAALPVARRRGETVVAGSFVTAGRGRVEVRESTPPTGDRPAVVSPVRPSFERLTPGLAALAGVLALIVIAARIVDGLEVADLRGPAVGLVSLVPVGLALLVTAMNAEAAGRLHDQRVVVRHRDAVAGLAGVDVLCIDKTGTLTEPVLDVAVRERLRPDATETLAELRRQGITVKILSGDDARTVAEVAGQLELPGAEAPVDGRRLPDPETAEDEFTTAAEKRTVFGNLAPEQKRALVTALRSKGRRVAMVGDGINDIPAIREADLGIALASGSPETRAAAPVILAESRLEPLVTWHGQSTRLLDTVERLTALFLTKTVLAALLVLAAGAAGATMPLEAGHLVLVALLGLVAPAVALVLRSGKLPDIRPGPAVGERRPGTGLVEQALRCALPTGAVATAAAFASHTLAGDTVDTSSAGAATSAALTLFLVILWLVVTLLRTVPREPADDSGEIDDSAETGVSGRFPTWVTVPSGLAVAFAVALLVPPLRSLFGLEVDGALALLSGVGVAAIAGVALEVAWQTSGWDRPGRPS